MLGEKSLAVRSSLFFRGEVWKVLTTLSQLCASHIKRFRRSDKWGAVFRSIDDFPACFCMGRCLCLEPILPVATPVAALWRSTCMLACKPYRGHVLTSAAKITKESAVNHKEIDTNGVNRMLLRRPWRTDQKNRFLDKVWTPQFSTTPPKPFLLSFSTHLVDQTLAPSIWKRKSQFSNWPKD